MALLDDAIEASGGLARWNRLKRFTLQLSISGGLIARAGLSAFKDIVAEGCTRNQLVRLTGFAGPGICGIYRPSRVIIEDPEGKVLRTWQPTDPAALLPGNDAPDDELHAIFLCGLSLWNDLTMPFILAHPDVRTQELPPWSEQGQLWRRVRAFLPATAGVHPREQTFYFDATGMQRRTDHDLLGVAVADYSWAHQEFDGIVIPTLRRSLALAVDGTAIVKPSLIDVEIFDAAFE